MGVGPAVAMPGAVKAAGLQIDDIDLFEINEFLNSLPRGARGVSTLLNEMKRRGKDSRFGVISMCIGSGWVLQPFSSEGMPSISSASNAKSIQSVVNLLSKDVL
uniref:Thiolase C-terminal domain-containing protein n=1 Tax=Ananas comosus var. bracteatus TaxID=296719 RepID=A0A6V7PGK4_ANACO|nr:unnamed protein product [Ananas comosus var. bracteatus]